MQQWQYAVVEWQIRPINFVSVVGPGVKGNDLTEVLNQLGEQGWELVAASEFQYGALKGIRYVLKRPVRYVRGDDAG